MSVRGSLKRWLYVFCPGLSGAFWHFGMRVVFSKNPHSFQRTRETGTYEQDNLKLIATLVRLGTPYLGVCADIELNSNSLAQCVPIGRVASCVPFCKHSPVAVSPTADGWSERPSEASRGNSTDFDLPQE